jgi:hypothetical protein
MRYVRGLKGKPGLVLAGNRLERGFKGIRFLRIRSAKVFNGWLSGFGSDYGVRRDVGRGSGGGGFGITAKRPWGFGTGCGFFGLRGA